MCPVPLLVRATRATVDAASSALTLPRLVQKAEPIIRRVDSPHDSLTLELQEVGQQGAGRERAHVHRIVPVNLRDQVVR